MLHSTVGEGTEASREGWKKRLVYCELLQVKTVRVDRVFPVIAEPINSPQLTKQTNQSSQEIHVIRDNHVSAGKVVKVRRSSF